MTDIHFIWTPIYKLWRQPFPFISFETQCATCCFRELAGLAGEARQFSNHNQDISQAGRGQPAKYPSFFRVCSKIGSSGIIKSHQDMKRSHLWLVFISLARSGKNFPLRAPFFVGGLI